jgi:hypothetical protein
MIFAKPWSPRAPPVDPSWEFPALRPTFSRVLLHVSEEGDTSEIDVASLSTLTHVATYIRGKVIALGRDSYSSQALRTSKL